MHAEKTVLSYLSFFLFILFEQDELGMTYDELSVFGRLRKIEACGPFRMFCKLCDKWKDEHSPAVIADKVKHFFRLYATQQT